MSIARFQNIGSVWLLFGLFYFIIGISSLSLYFLPKTVHKGGSSGHLVLFD
jgi:hypothetical protein